MFHQIKWYLAFVFFAGVVLTYFYEMRLVLYEYQPSLIDELKPYDCGVVLTGASGRLRESFEIMAQKKVKKLIVSGVFKDTQLMQIFPLLPFYPEINEENIILEKHSESTFGNAVQSLAIVKTLQCKNVLLMTSQLHMHRAFKIFKKIYSQNIPIAAFSIANPSKEATKMDTLIEVNKSVFYTIFGRVLELLLSSLMT